MPRAALALGLALGLGLGLARWPAMSQMLITVAPIGAVTLQTFDATEYTTMSATPVDLVTLAIRIEAPDALMLAGLIRSTAAANTVGRLGVKINGTEIIAPGQVLAGAANAARSGAWTFGPEDGWGAARSAGYTQGALLQASTGLLGLITLQSTLNTYAAQLPAPPWTSVTLTASVVADSSVTLAIRDVAVYRVARQ